MLIGKHYLTKKTLVGRSCKYLLQYLLFLYCSIRYIINSKKLRNTILHYDDLGLLEISNKSSNYMIHINTIPNQYKSINLNTIFTVF